MFVRWCHLPSTFKGPTGKVTKEAPSPPQASPRPLGQGSLVRLGVYIGWPQAYRQCERRRDREKCTRGRAEANRAKREDLISKIAILVDILNN